MTVKVKILSNFNYQTFPLTDDMVEVEEELLARIAIDKQFDVENKRIIDYKKPLEEIEKEKAEQYPILVEQYIREKYSLSAELAILRQRDVKIDEFNEYDVYAEFCKNRAKEEISKLYE